jgi:hypothetical protein
VASVGGGKTSAQLPKYSLFFFLIPPFCSGIGRWRQDGCTVLNAASPVKVQVDGSLKVTCQCSQLGTFAVHLEDVSTQCAALLMTPPQLAAYHGVAVFYLLTFVAAFVSFAQIVWPYKSLRLSVPPSIIWQQTAAVGFAFARFLDALRYGNDVAQEGAFLTGRWCECSCDVHLCSFVCSALCARKSRDRYATLHTAVLFTAASLAMLYSLFAKPGMHCVLCSAHATLTINDTFHFRTHTALFTAAPLAMLYSLFAMLVMHWPALWRVGRGSRLHPCT